MRTLPCPQISPFNIPKTSFSLFPFPSNPPVSDPSCLLHAGGHLSQWCWMTIKQGNIINCIHFPPLHPPPKQAVTGVWNFLLHLTTCHVTLLRARKRSLSDLPSSSWRRRPRSLFLRKQKLVSSFIFCSGRDRGTEDTSLLTKELECRQIVWALKYLVVSLIDS